MKKRTLLSPEVRSNQILSAAVRVVRDMGWEGLTRDRVAEEAECAVGTINNIYGTMDDLRDAVMTEAINIIENGDHCDEIIKVVSHGLANGDKIAKSAPRMVKDLAFAMMGAS